VAPSAYLAVEPLGADVVAALQCMAIDADAFPYASAHFGLRSVAARVLVARDAAEGRVVGFVAGHARRGVLRIEGLAVDRAVRRRGVGRALVRGAVALASAEGLFAIALHVAVANRAALALYDAEGFEVVRRLRDFYPAAPEGERDAYEMRRSMVRPPTSARDRGSTA
jgi:ribosomal protein S18 acetylase RimI-like enzyme